MNDGFKARTGTSTYLVLGTLIGLPFSIFLLDALRTRSWSAAALFALPVLGGTLWLLSYRLQIVNGVVTYRSLFGGKRVIPLADIRTATTATSPTAPFGPFYRLTLFPASPTDRPVIINMKVFSRKDLQQVFDILGPKLKERRLSVFDPKRRN